jgi:hypothetical protein
VRWIIQQDQDAQDLVQEACNPRISARARALDLAFLANSETGKALLPAIDGGLSLVGDRLSAGNFSVSIQSQFNLMIDPGSQRDSSIHVDAPQMDISVIHPNFIQPRVLS